jgi:hypothetical protein
MITAMNNSLKRQAHILDWYESAVTKCKASFEDASQKLETAKQDVIKLLQDGDNTYLDLVRGREIISTALARFERAKTQQIGTYITLIMSWDGRDYGMSM